MAKDLDHVRAPLDAASPSPLLHWVELGGELGRGGKPEIWDWDYLKGWQAPSAKGHEFSIVGHFPNGDLLALWRYPELQGPRPFVFLGHEWTFKVLAADGLAFLELVAGGAFEGEPDTAPRPEPTGFFGRAFLKLIDSLGGVVTRDDAHARVLEALQEAGRAEPRAQEAIEAEAEAAHPDLTKAFDAWDDELQPFIEESTRWRLEHKETQGSWPSEAQEDAFYAQFFQLSPTG